MNPITTLKDTTFSRGRDYIGASDMGTLAGLTKRYRTPVDLYLERIGEAEPFSGNEHTRWGHIQENNILAEYAQRNGGDFDGFMLSRYNDELCYYCGDAVFRSLTEARHPDNDRFVAHADLLVEPREDEPYLVQAKNLEAELIVLFFSFIREFKYLALIRIFMQCWDHLNKHTVGSQKWLQVSETQNLKVFSRMVMKTGPFKNKQ